MKVFAMAAQKASLPSDKWKNLLIQTIIVGVSAALTWVVQNQGKLDLGEYSPIVVAVSTVVLSYLQKFLANPVVPPTPLPDNSKPEPKPTNTDKEVDYPIRSTIADIKNIPDNDNDSNFFKKS